MAGYDFLNHCIDLAKQFFDSFVDFFSALTTPISLNSAGLPGYGGGIVALLQLFGLNTESTSLLSLFFGLGIMAFVVIHILKFLLK